MLHIEPPLPVFAVGPDAAAVERSGCSSQEIGKHVLRAVTDFVGSVFGVPASAVPEPSGVHVTDWGRDLASAGAYSYLRVNGDWHDSEMLAAPISLHPDAAGGGANVVDGVDWEDGEVAASRAERLPQPVLWWAGEATQGEYMGTMHAAVLSGQLAAQGIASNQRFWEGKLTEAGEDAAQ